MSLFFWLKKSLFSLNTKIQVTNLAEWATFLQMSNNQ